MKIQTLAAVLLSTFAISTAYAADEAMPAGDNMTQSATTAAPADKAADTSATAKKHTKKHKKHKKHHHKKTASEAAPAEATTAEPATK